MRPLRLPSGPISIEQSAPRVSVDNRISLRNYYRIADSLIRQANVYRHERNIIDLYVMLLRFSSLITETIPSHQDYRFFLQGEKIHFKTKLLDALNELERLKPAVQNQLAELNKKPVSPVNGAAQTQHIGSIDSYQWPAIKNQVQRGVGGDSFSQIATAQRDNLPLAKPREDQFRRLLLNIPPPKEETLLRHSILGPNGLQGQWQPPIVDQIQYPSNLDLAPIDMQSLLYPIENKPEGTKPTEVVQPPRTHLEEVLSLHDNGAPLVEQSSPSTNLDVTESVVKLDIIREPSPPPVRADVQDLVPVTSHISDHLPGQTTDFQDQLLNAQSPLEVHIVIKFSVILSVETLLNSPLTISLYLFLFILCFFSNLLLFVVNYQSTSLMDSFMRFAKSNTDRNLETCGVLAGSLKNRTFYVTALIIPKQEATSDSCQTTNEEEVFDYQDKNSLFSLGWIHTHPTQSCFMSSIDIHTQYSYQVMLPEAIAIVMAPRDCSRKYGIFRLTVPGGMSVVKKCPHSGFHPHQSPPDGGPIYKNCTDVYVSPDLKFEVADLR